MYVEKSTAKNSQDNIVEEPGWKTCTQVYRDIHIDNC